MTFFPVLTAKQRTDEIKLRQKKTLHKIAVDRSKQHDRNEWSVPRMALYHLVRHQWFEAGCGVIILFNMVLVVLETDATVDDGEPAAWVAVLTNILLGIYTMELIMKLFVYRLQFFAEMWNVLDFFIVGVDLVFLGLGFIVELPSLSVLRVFRLVRLARAFKAAKSLRELHSLLRACACALKAIFWGMVMMGLTLTVWGILSVQLIHPVNIRVHKTKPYLYADCDRCPRAFSTVFDSVLTIWKQIVAGDSWGTLCEPIVEEERWTFIFFVLVFVTVALTMLNCILAVVVEAGAAAAAADEHDKAIQQEKVVMKAEEKLVGICAQLDSDGSGSLSIKEFLDGFKNNSDFKECLEVMHVTEEDMYMIFNICDEDDSGDVDYKEFVDQLRRIKHSGEQMLLHYVTDIRHVCNKIGHHLRIPYLTEQDRGKTPEEDERAEKLDETKLNVSSSEVQDASLLGAIGVMPPSFGDSLDNQKMEVDKLLSFPWNLLPGFGQTENWRNINDPVAAGSLYQEQLERIYKINQNVVAIMNDVARQSQLQTVLLNKLVVQPRESTGGSVDNSNGDLMKPLVPLTPRAQAAGQTSAIANDANPGIAQLRSIDAIVRTGIDPSQNSSSCCARLL